jgi:protein farnesyltransferase subunit beta
MILGMFFVTLYSSNPFNGLRSCYAVIGTAYLTNIITEELIGNVSEYLASCQNYEGGFGSHPGTEAHGGYTICSILTLLILDRLELINKPQLLVSHLHG